ncbi:hypothetical protein BV22DRAFT_857030 [Leucogyrophana mollusca]|uniref:Uncharacterized protein n=1 Tax=Leucogyrophana mollusca TaxID=85980 RepID=A0ACB8B1W5_9AGAM|nr:hypothetical protein BV22DRAFT_857030 [Leucogyrophana mollusca]
MARTKAGPRIPDNHRPSPNSQPPTAPATVSYRGHRPSIADIIHVKKYLAQLTPRLPIELIDQILDDAWYWAHSSVTVQGHVSVPNYITDGVRSRDKMYVRTLPLAVPGSEGDIGGGNDMRELVLGTVPVDAGSSQWAPPRGNHPCRMIEFQIWSRDQGYSPDVANHSTYRESYSWFDACVETPKLNFHSGKDIPWPSSLLTTDSSRLWSEHPKFICSNADDNTPTTPSPRHIQRNVHASTRTHHHVVTWHHRDYIEQGSAQAVEADLKGQGWQSLDGTFVRNLSVGDCITLRMRARPDGLHLWTCHAEKATIDVYWAV